MLTVFFCNLQYLPLIQYTRYIHCLTKPNYVYKSPIYKVSIYRFSTSKKWVTAIAQCLRCCATNRKVAGSISAGVSGFFIDIKSFRSHCGPGVDSASNRKDFLAVKEAGA